MGRITKLLSESSAAFDVLNSIVSSQIGYSGEIVGCSGYLAGVGWKQDGSYELRMNFGELDLFQNQYNMQMTLFHEQHHIMSGDPRIGLDPEEKDYQDMLDAKLVVYENNAYEAMINHPSFAYTSSAFKEEIAQGWYNACGSRFGNSLNYYRILCGL